MSVIDIKSRRQPTHYSVLVTHHWDGRVEVQVEGVADDARSRRSAATAFRAAAKLLSKDAAINSEGDRP